MEFPQFAYHVPGAKKNRSLWSKNKEMLVKFLLVNVITHLFDVKE